MTRPKTRARGVLSLGIAAVLGLLVQSPASAAGQDGVSNWDEFHFFYNSASGTGMCQGSFSDFAAAKSNLAGYVFLSDGAGKGQAVKNNSACAFNARNQTARVYFNSNYQGPSDLVGYFDPTNLTNTYNENASFRWV